MGALEKIYIAYSFCMKYQHTGDWLFVYIRHIWKYQNKKRRGRKEKEMRRKEKEYLDPYSIAIGLPHTLFNFVAVAQVGVVVS